VASKKEIEAMSFKQLAAFMEQAKARMDEMRAKEIEDARAKVTEMLTDLNISIFELMGVPEPSAPRPGRPKGSGNGTRKPAELKYKLPSGNLWSGRGRLPLELREALNGSVGYDPETAQFATKEAREAALRRFLIQ
jgi:DNA-binding protein H-NS